MDGFRLSRAAFIIVCVSIVGAQGCGSPVKSSKSEAPGFNIGGGGGDAFNPDPEDEPTEAAGLFFKLTSDIATINLHRTLVTEPYTNGAGNRVDVGTTNWTQECRIASNAADGTRDVLCVAEVNELDMYFSPMVLQYHVPPSMCSYVSFIPYHFYAYEPAEGPSFVSHEELEDGSIVGEINSLDGVPLCQYDYRENLGPNCCRGTYTRAVTRPAPTDTNPTATETTISLDQEWGGDIPSCLSGPAMSSAWSAFRNDAGYPVSSIEYVEGVGFNNTFAIDAAINSQIGEKDIESNVWAANFYNPINHVGSGGLVPTQVPPIDPNRPVAMKIPANVVANDRYFPQDTYMLTCYDRNQEIKSRLRLMIREWNRNLDYQDGGDSDFSAGTDPDFPDSPVNDRLDWLDFGVVYPASST
jgi:hypothetical protein